VHGALRRFVVNEAVYNKLSKAKFQVMARIYDECLDQLSMLAKNLSGLSHEQQGNVSEVIR